MNTELPSPLSTIKQTDILSSRNISKERVKEGVSQLTDATMLSSGKEFGHTLRHQVTHLTTRQERWLKVLRYEIMIYFPAFWVILIVFPSALVISCSEGHNWGAHIIMGIFSLCVTLADFYMCCKRPVCSAPPPLAYNIWGNFKRLFQYDWTQFVLEEIPSFLGHLDIYTDFCFITICVHSQIPDIYWPSILFFLVTCTPKHLGYYNYLRGYITHTLLTGKGHRGEQDLLANFEMKGLAMIYSKSIGSAEFTLSLKNLIYINVWKLLSEDLPQFSMQLYYLTHIQEYCNGENASMIIYISLVISMLTSIASFIQAIIEFLNVYQHRALIQSLRAPAAALSDHNITEDEGQFIFKTLQRNQDIKSFSLKNCKQNANAIRDICAAIKFNQALEEFYFCDNTIEESSVEYMAEALQQNVSLQKIDFSNTKFGGNEGITKILEAIWANSGIEHAKLCNMGINPNNVFALCQIISNHLSMKTLNLSSNKLGNEGIEILREALTNTLLTEINLGNNELTDKGIFLISDIIANNDTLESLGLNGNEITEIGAKSLINALRKNHNIQNIDYCLPEQFSKRERLEQIIHSLLTINRTLRKETSNEFIANIAIQIKLNSPELLTLELTDKELTESDIKLLLEPITTNTNLQSINFSRNIIDLNSAKHIARGINRNNSIKEIILENCQIDDNSAEYILNSLKVNKKIKMISLNGNNIGDRGGKILGQVLRNNRTLARIKLSQNNMTDSSITEIQGACVKNKSIKKIHLRNNKFSKGGKNMTKAYLGTLFVL